MKQASPPKPILRTAAVLLAVVFALTIPAAQAVFQFGMPPDQFAADGDETLRAASYAFSIWSLIYFGMAAYAVYQALPSTANSAWLTALGWPSVIAFTGCGLWILAGAYDQKALTVLIIVVSALSLIAPLWRGGDVRRASTRQTWLILWPLGLLAGWLTIASAINLLTVLTAADVITPQTGPAWAAAGIIVVALAGVLMVNRTRLIAYAIPIAWGFAAVYIAERADQPVIALLAAGAGALVLAFALVKTLRDSTHAAAHP